VEARASSIRCSGSLPWCRCARSLDDTSWPDAVHLVVHAVPWRFRSPSIWSAGLVGDHATCQPGRWGVAVGPVRQNLRRRLVLVARQKGKIPSDSSWLHPNRRPLAPLGRDDHPARRDRILRSSGIPAPHLYSMADLKVDEPPECQDTGGGVRRAACNKGRLNLQGDPSTWLPTPSPVHRPALAGAGASGLCGRCTSGSPASPLQAAATAYAPQLLLKATTGAAAEGRTPNIRRRTLATPGWRPAPPRPSSFPPIPTPT